MVIFRPPEREKGEAASKTVDENVNWNMFLKIKWVMFYSNIPCTRIYQVVRFVMNLQSTLAFAL